MSTEIACRCRLSAHAEPFHIRNIPDGPYRCGIAERSSSLSLASSATRSCLNVSLSRSSVQPTSCCLKRLMFS